MPTPADLQTLINAINWTNNSGQITGPELEQLFNECVTLFGSPGVTLVTTSTTLAITTDIGLQRTVSVAAMVANLPSSAIAGQAFKVEDLVGNLQAFPVTVTPPAGHTIVGRATFVMNEDYQSTTFRYYGSNIWSVS